MFDKLPKIQKDNIVLLQNILENSKNYSFDVFLISKKGKFKSFNSKNNCRLKLVFYKKNRPNKNLLLNLFYNLKNNEIILYYYIGKKSFRFSFTDSNYIFKEILNVHINYMFDETDKISNSPLLFKRGKQFNLKDFSIAAAAGLYMNTFSLNSKQKISISITLQNLFHELIELNVEISFLNDLLFKDIDLININEVLRDNIITNERVYSKNRPYKIFDIVTM